MFLHICFGSCHTNKRFHNGRQSLLCAEKLMAVQLSRRIYMSVQYINSSHSWVHRTWAFLHCNCCNSFPWMVKDMLHRHFMVSVPCVMFQHGKRQRACAAFTVIWSLFQNAILNVFMKVQTVHFGSKIEEQIFSDEQWAKTVPTALTQWAHWISSEPIRAVNLKPAVHQIPSLLWALECITIHLVAQASTLDLTALIGVLQAYNHIHTLCVQF